MSNRDYDQERERNRYGDYDRDRGRFGRWGREGTYGREGWGGYGAESDWEGTYGREGGYGRGYEWGPGGDYGRGADRGPERRWGGMYGGYGYEPYWGWGGYQGYWPGGFGWRGRWREPSFREGYGWEGRQGGYGQGTGYTNMGQHSGRGPRNYQRSDDRIKEDINDRLTEHGDIDATEIQVQVHSGEVMLQGSVDSRYAKRLAEDIADSVTGVRDVRNELRVTQPVSQTQQQRQAA